jgi:hypothetical protein
MLLLEPGIVMMTWPIPGAPLPAENKNNVDGCNYCSMDMSKNQPKVQILAAIKVHLSISHL